MSEPLRILSLGAGVQSSALALMIKRGEIQMVHGAIFADTGNEPTSVTDYLDYLKGLLNFPIYVVSAGNLAEDFLRALADPKGRCGQPPFMVYNEAKREGARIWRQCTKEYKLDPIRRKVRELRTGNQHVEQLIGISLDEAHRMKPSGVKYITNTYPLIDKRMSRHDCLRWIAKHGYKTPPKSACWHCPYISNKRLRDMKDNDPCSWGKLVNFDHAMRAAQKATINGAKITGTLYVHRDCKPIDQVDLTNDKDVGQMDMFTEECTGMCGV